jgi:uncharacterized protein (DUF302 family)
MNDLEITLTTSHDDAIEQVIAALKSHGFGVLTRADVEATLSGKLGVDFHPYTILGACQPSFAHRALSIDPNIGLLMPCNVIVYEPEPGRTVVRTVDPMETMARSGIEGVEPMAREVRALLAGVIEELGA